MLEICSYLELSDLFNIRQLSRQSLDMLVNSGIASSNRVFNVIGPDPMPQIVDEDWIDNFWARRCAILQLVSEIKFDVEACKGLFTIP